MTPWSHILERQPEPYAKVLVFVEMPTLPAGEITIGHITDDGDWLTRPYHGPVHWWMPLPDPPAGE